MLHYACGSAPSHTWTDLGLCRIWSLHCLAERGRHSSFENAKISSFLAQPELQAGVAPESTGRQPCFAVAKASGLGSPGIVKWNRQIEAAGSSLSSFLSRGSARHRGQGCSGEAGKAAAQIVWRELQRGQCWDAAWNSSRLGGGEVLQETAHGPWLSDTPGRNQDPDILTYS